jgi:hypothetical protein
MAIRMKQPVLDGYGRSDSVRLLKHLAAKRKPEKRENGVAGGEIVSRPPFADGS